MRLGSCRRSCRCASLLTLFTSAIVALFLGGKATLILAAAPTSQPAPMTIPKYPEDPGFAPGKQVEIDDPQTADGDLTLKDTDPTSHFVVYTPSDYDAARSFPVILTYHGKKGQPTPWPYKDLTGGKGFIIVGMQYLRPACYRIDAFYDGQYIKRLLTYLKAHLNIDTHMVFMGGFSQGGWKVAGGTSDKLIDSLAGIIISSAGRLSTPPLPGIRGKPVLITAGETDPGRPIAESAVTYYKQQGAEVTLIIFPKAGHAIDAGNAEMKKWIQDNGPARQARVNFALAEKARAAGTLGEAFSIYTSIAKNPAAGEWKAKAEAAAAELESDATKKLADAEGLITGRKYPEARKAFSALTTPWAGSSFADTAHKRLDALDKDPAILADIKQAGIDTRADAAEANALAAEKSKDYAKAFKIYENYLTAFAASHRISEVKAHLEELKADKTIVAAAYKQDADRDGKSNYDLAYSYLQAGKPEQAKPLLDEIVKKYPDTDWAAKAKALLATIK